MMMETTSASQSVRCISKRSVTASGSATAPPSEATETYRVEAKSRSQTQRHRRKAAGKRATITPAELAMPFPPLKPSQIGKL
jgi:hypothetical protein